MSRYPDPGAHSAYREPASGSYEAPTRLLQPTFKGGDSVVHRGSHETTYAIYVAPDNAGSAWIRYKLRGGGSRDQLVESALLEHYSPKFTRGDVVSYRLLSRVWQQATVDIDDGHSKNVGVRLPNTRRLEWCDRTLLVLQSDLDMGKVPPHLAPR